MKKRSKSKSSTVPRVDPYLEGLMAKLLERLVGLEKKMDVMIAQTAGRTSGNGDQPKQPPRQERQLYEAVCADCHKVCEVPFRPSEDRPVYCKGCFAKRLPGRQAGKAGGSGKVYPILTPVAMPLKTISKSPVTLPVRSALPKRTKKSPPAKKVKKKK